MPYGLEKFGVIRAFSCYILGSVRYAQGKNYHSRRHTIKTYAQKYKNVRKEAKRFCEKPIVKNIQKFKCLYRKMGSNSVKNREMVMVCYKKH